MATSSLEWIDEQTDRVLSTQLARSQGNTLLVTFSLAVSAAFVAAALQVGVDGKSFDDDLWVPIGAFVVATILAAVVVLTDRLASPDVPEILRRTRGRPDGDRLRMLRRSSLAAQHMNAEALRTTFWLTVAQMTASAVTWCLVILWFVARPQA